MSWGTGQQLNNNRYEIIHRIGTGGFGVTYKALDRKAATPNAVVAIKTLNEKRQRQANFEQLQENFINEALSLAKCSHPHIIRVERVFAEGQIWAMVMDYIEGESLEDYLIDRGKLPEPKAVEIIQKIGGAVSYVHTQKLLHRDIKPANILIKPNGEPILIDFGLAREFAAGIARSMTSDRTPHYSPPEQAERRGDFQPPLDIYALAATLYTCVTGDLPQMAEIRIVRDSLIPPQQLNSGISDGVNRAILTGMALKPEDRSSTVAEWLELLQPLAKSISPPPTSAKLVHQRFRFEIVDRIEIDYDGYLGGFFGTKINIIKWTLQAEYITEDLGNGVKLEMVSIPAGSFLMGSLEGEGNDNEKPQHLVNVPAFYMGKYPITQSQYLVIMGKTPFHYEGGDLPVEQISWNNTQEFCQNLSRKTGKKYRLPSEAEWEYACRAGTRGSFNCGETITAHVANFNGKNPYGDVPKSKYRGKTTPVGFYKVANKFGLCDMHGNVQEWCLDEYKDNYDSAPTDGSANGSAKSRFWGREVHPLRGGSWSSDPINCRSACRGFQSENDYKYGSTSANNKKYLGIGFRVVFSHNS